MTRVSDQSIFNANLRAFDRLRTSISDLQEQIATGRRIQRPSDDPVGASRLLEFRESVTRIQQFQRNASLAESRLQLEEDTLRDATNALQRVRELVLQAANASQSSETRGFIAEELNQSVEALLTLANTRDATDGFLFSGFQSGQQPFTRTVAGFQYNGDQGQRFLQISSSRQVPDSDPGDAIFARLREGNGQVLVTPNPANTGTGVALLTTTSPVTSYNLQSYRVEFTSPTDYDVVDSGGVVLTTGVFDPETAIDVAGFQIELSGNPSAGDSFDLQPSPNTDVFSVVQRIADVLEDSADSPGSRAEVDNEINRALGGIDQALNQVLTVRTKVGTRLSAVEAQIDTNAGTELVLQRSLAEIEDLDYAEAISLLASQTTALEAAQQTFVRTQSLSLFNFLR
ncbi:MAG: flagellar hook-associated protein FlgL [Pseudomonadota bacterium]